MLVLEQLGDYFKEQNRQWNDAFRNPPWCWSNLRMTIRKTMARELSVVIKTDKSDKKSTSQRQGGCVVCKRETRLKCKKCSVKLDHYKVTVFLMRTIRT